MKNYRTNNQSLALINAGALINPVILLERGTNRRLKISEFDKIRLFTQQPNSFFTTTRAFYSTIYDIRLLQEIIFCKRFFISLYTKAVLISECVLRWQSVVSRISPEFETDFMEIARKAENAISKQADIIPTRADIIPGQEILILKYANDFLKQAAFVLNKANVDTVHTIQNFVQEIRVRKRAVANSKYVIGVMTNRVQGLKCAGYMCVLMSFVVVHLYIINSLIV